MKKRFVGTVIVVALGSLLFAQQPYWWDNPHKDDDFNMYERGMAAGAASEQDALKKAVQSAKAMLVERIGIESALRDAGLSSSPEYAIVNFTVSDSGTEKKGKTWNAWTLIKYPQEEKRKILDRWNASISSINDLKEQEKKIPVEFALSLRTADGRTQYREGERVDFSVTADRDCYLVLLDHMSDGTTVLLFPNRFHPDSLIRKGQTVSIPPVENENFRIVVGAPFGDDRIEAIAATEKSFLHSEFTALIGNLGVNQNMAVVTRGLFVEALGSTMGSAQSTGVKWSRAELNLSTYQK